MVNPTCGCPARPWRKQAVEGAAGVVDERRAAAFWAPLGTFSTREVSGADWKIGTNDCIQSEFAECNRPTAVAYVAPSRPLPPRRKARSHVTQVDQLLGKLCSYQQSHVSARQIIALPIDRTINPVEFHATILKNTCKTIDYVGFGAHDNSNCDLANLDQFNACFGGYSCYSASPGKKRHFAD